MQGGALQGTLGVGRDPAKSIKTGGDARLYLLRKSLKKAESRAADSSRSKPFSTAVL